MGSTGLPGGSVPLEGYSFLPELVPSEPRGV